MLINLNPFCNQDKLQTVTVVKMMVKTIQQMKKKKRKKKKKKMMMMMMMDGSLMGVDLVIWRTSLVGPPERCLIQPS